MARRILRLLVLLGFQLGAIFLLLECAVRLARPFNRQLNTLLYLPSVLTAYDEIASLEQLLELTPLGFSPFSKWHGFVLNSRSFRTREYPAQRTPGAYRIVTIGDSFTLGVGHYSTSWSVQLERRLAALLGREVEAFALGAPGVGPQFELRLWELERDLLEPDLVILAFFVGNDFTDDEEHELQGASQTPLVQISFVFRLVRNLYRSWAD